MIPVIAVFYAVGLTGHIYEPARSLMIRLTPFVIALFGIWTFIIAALSSDRRLLAWSAGVYAVTFVLEAAGVKTGLIFGTYSYGETLGFKLFDVPLVIGFNWMIIILGLSELSRRISRTPLLSALIAAAAAVIFDAVLEPVAMALDYWSWEGGAVPIHNYAAWFIISFFAALSYGGLKIKTSSAVSSAYIVIQFVFFTAILIAFGLSLSVSMSFG